VLVLLRGFLGGVLSINWMGDGMKIKILKDCFTCRKGVLKWLLAGQVVKLPQSQAANLLLQKKAEVVL
jgi:hypothetical protein